MQIIWGSSDRPGLNDALAGWIAARIWNDGRQLPDKRLCLGVFDDDGNVVAGIAYHNWQPTEATIEFSGASSTKRWLTRPVLWAMFEYPFNQLGCQMTFARIDPANRSLARILTAYGFETTVLPRMRGRDKDELLMTLTQEAWLANGFHRENENGQA